MKLEAAIKGCDIKTLIPQREPIIMVDIFEGIENGISYSGLTVVENNLFCEDGFLNESGIIEHIAQSAAARVGYVCMESNIPIPLGFIGSVEKMNIYNQPRIGDKLDTEISIIQEVFNITLISAHVKSGNQLIAECRMKIVLNKNEEKTL